MTTSAAPADARRLTRWEYVTVPVVAAGFEDAAGIENYHGDPERVRRAGVGTGRGDELPGHSVRGGSWCSRSSGRPGDAESISIPAVSVR